MTLVATPTSVPAGDVTFVVKNTGTIDHEMIVLKTDTPFDQLPVADAGDPPAPVTTGADKVDESGQRRRDRRPEPQAGRDPDVHRSRTCAGQVRAGLQHRRALPMGMRAPFTVT